VKSFDAGMTWSKADSGIYSDVEVGPSQLAIDPLHPETLYVGTSGIWPGTFYKSTNGGAFWSSRGDSTYLSLGPTTIAVNPESTNVVYAGTNGNGRIMRSTDYGETWNYTGLSDGVTRTIKFSKYSSTVFVGSSTERRCGFFQSTNAGGSWSNIENGIVDSIFDVQSIEFDGTANNRRIFITGNTHVGKSRIYYKYEDESKWKLMQIDTTGTPFYMFAIHNGRFWIGSSRGLYALDVPTKAIQQEPSTIPSEIKLFPNYPNPFNPTTLINYHIPINSFVSLTVFDLLGKEIAQLVNEQQKAGKYSAQFDGTQFSTGIYLYRLRSNTFSETKKMLLIK
jgi:hypothetical protein